MQIKITTTTAIGNPPGLLAHAELHFTDGPLTGLKLIGFSIWQRRGGGYNVTFPARSYAVNGERRSFALLRPIADANAQEALRSAILTAYYEHSAEDAGPQEPPAGPTYTARATTTAPDLEF